jgi:hypothetical protein
MTPYSLRQVRLTRLRRHLRRCAGRATRAPRRRRPTHQQACVACSPAAKPQNTHDDETMNTLTHTQGPTGEKNTTITHTSTASPVAHVWARCCVCVCVATVATVCPPRFQAAPANNWCPRSNKTTTRAFGVLQVGSGRAIGANNPRTFSFSPRPITCGAREAVRWSAANRRRRASDKLHRGGGRRGNNHQPRKI